MENIANKIKILIAEDVRLIQKLYLTGLSDDIFEIKIVGNGHDALTAYKEWQPDIIILDIMMPLINGYGVLERIREHQKDKQTFILIATSIAEKESVLKCLKLGIQGYILKPIKKGEITQQVLDYYEKKVPEKVKKIKLFLKETKLRKISGELEADKERAMFEESELTKGAITDDYYVSETLDSEELNLKESDLDKLDQSETDNKKKNYVNN